MQDQLTDHLDQQLKSTSLENFSDYLKNLQQLPSLQDFFFCLLLQRHDLKIYVRSSKTSGSITKTMPTEILKLGTESLILPRDYLLVFVVLGSSHEY